jgi:hypothetical protein
MPIDTVESVDDAALYSIFESIGDIETEWEGKKISLSFNTPYLVHFTRCYLQQMSQSQEYKEALIRNCQPLFAAPDDELLAAQFLQAIVSSFTYTIPHIYAYTGVRQPSDALVDTIARRGFVSISRGQTQRTVCQLAAPALRQSTTKISEFVKDNKERLLLGSAALVVAGLTTIALHTSTGIALAKPVIEKPPVEQLPQVVTPEPEVHWLTRLVSLFS